jgi:hypothetical protein
MGFQGAMEKKVEEQSGAVIMWGLVLVAVLLLLVAFFVKNKWVQAAFLAWVVLP